MNDSDYMKLAIELAKKGEGAVSPNPMVGAVIVKDGRIIGKGCHEEYGKMHAERNALASCTESTEGATIYVTLEPCCHYGKQPPCTEAIINAGIKRVVVGSRDPNPLVSGKGNKLLRKNGIVVEEDFMKEECDSLNPVFFHYITKKMPYVIMKYAMTMDGKIAAYTGDSKWVTGKETRNRVHRDRSRYTGIMVGSQTVLNDNPMLTCRIPGGKNPIRIICDTRLRTPLDSNIVNTARDIRTIIATGNNAISRYDDYISRGCEMITVNEKGGHIDITELMYMLAAMKIDSILLEGGGTLNFAALNAGVVNRVQAYIAPKIIGGKDSVSPVEGMGIAHMSDAVKLKNSVINRIGEDYMIESEVVTDVYGDN